MADNKCSNSPQWLRWGASNAVGLIAVIVLVTWVCSLMYPEVGMNVTAFVDAVAWPVAVFAVVFLFRDEFRSAITRLSQRVKKASVACLDVIFTEGRDEVVARTEKILRNRKDLPPHELAERIWREMVSGPELLLLLVLSNNIRDGMNLGPYTESGPNAAVYEQALERIIQKGLAEPCGKRHVLTKEGVGIIWDRIDEVKQNYDKLRKGE